MGNVISSVDQRCLRLLSIPTAVAAGAVAFWFLRKHWPRTYKQVGYVTALNVFPVKSCKAIALEQAECLDYGIEYDRNWVLQDKENRFVSQRQQPTLALVEPKFGGDGYLYVNAPGMETLKLPMDLKSYGDDPARTKIRVFEMWGEGVFAGAEASEWFCKYLQGPGFKLYFLAKPRYLNTDGTWHALAQPQDKCGFSDYGPYMLATEKSLDYLNSELPSPMPMKRFRPNIVTSGVEKAHLEDNWHYIKIGNVEFRKLNNCGRCNLTTVNPETGQKEGSELLATLRRIRMPEDRDKRYGNAPFFGIYLAPERQGMIKMGDAVFVAS